MGVKRWMWIPVFVAAAVILTGFALIDEPKTLKKELKEARKKYLRLEMQIKKLEPEMARLEKGWRETGRLTRDQQQKILEKRREINSLTAQKMQYAKEYAGVIKRVIDMNNLEGIKLLWKSILSKGSKLIYPETEAIEALLKNLTDNEAIKFIAGKLNHSHIQTKITLCRAFTNMDPHAAVMEALLECLKDSKWEVVSAAAIGLTKHKNKDVVVPLIEALEKSEKDDNARLSTDIRTVLRRITGQVSLTYAEDFKNWWNQKGKNEELPDAPVTGGESFKGIRTYLYGEITSKKVIFVIDHSHSMIAEGTVPENKHDKENPVTGGPDKKAPGAERRGGVEPGFKGTRMAMLKKEFEYILTQLPPDTEFNIIAYNSKVKPLSRKLFKASESNKKKALHFIKELEANFQTATYDALMLALSDHEVDTIYLLTDGAPTMGKVTHPAQILSEVRRVNMKRNIKINCVALLVGDYTGGQPQPQPGQQPGQQQKRASENKKMMAGFLNALAKQNGGTFRMIAD